MGGVPLLLYRCCCRNCCCYFMSRLKKNMAWNVVEKLNIYPQVSSSSQPGKAVGVAEIRGSASLEQRIWSWTWTCTNLVRYSGLRQGWQDK